MGQVPRWTIAGMGHQISALQETSMSVQQRKIRTIALELKVLITSTESLVWEKSRKCNEKILGTFVLENIQWQTRTEVDPLCGYQ